MGATAVTTRIAACAAVIALTACGAAPTEPNAVESAAAEAAEAGTARIESTVTFGGAEGTITLALSGVVDYRNDRSEITYRFADVPTRTITIGDVVYQELPGVGGPQWPAKRWTRSAFDAEAHACDPVPSSARGETVEAESDEPASPEDDAEPAEEEDSATKDGGGNGHHVTDTDQLGVGEPTIVMSFAPVGYALDEDPGRYLQYLSDVDAGPTDLGREALRNFATTHYRAVADERVATRRDLERAGWSDDAAIDCAVKAESEDPVYIDIWVDDAGLPRRVVAERRHEDTKWVSTTDYFDYGLQVDIQPPAADEVLTLEEWEAGFGLPSG